MLFLFGAESVTYLRKFTNINFTARTQMSTYDLHTSYGLAFLSQAPVCSYLPSSAASADSRLSM
jgi:hypothetical protein